MMMPDHTLSNAVVRVGEGRGFIIEVGYDRLVVTAAHCLPRFPPCHAANYTQDLTYTNLLGRLDNPAPDVWAECLFVDPVADIAVLGTPDTQELFNEAEAYSALTDDGPVLVIVEAEETDTDENVPGWLLSLDGNWTRCNVGCVASHRSLWIENAESGIRGGMSGSPILNDQRLAIGVVSVGSSAGTLESSTGGGPNPRLTHNLPGWLLRDTE